MGPKTTSPALIYFPPTAIHQCLFLTKPFVLYFCPFCIYLTFNLKFFTFSLRSFLFSNFQLFISSFFIFHHNSLFCLFSLFMFFPSSSNDRYAPPSEERGRLFPNIQTPVVFFIVKSFETFKPFIMYFEEFQLSQYGLPLGGILWCLMNKVPGFWLQDEGQVLRSRLKTK